VVALMVAGCGGGNNATQTKANAPAPKPANPCDRHASPHTFAATIAAAKPGETVCLASGDYGNWSGTDEPITVAAAPGAVARMQFAFGPGSGGFTMTGLQGMGGTISRGAGDITIKDSTFASAVALDGLAHAGITFDHDTFKNISNPGCKGQPARIHLEYSSVTPSGVLVENSQFSGGDTDGIQTGAPMVIKGNVFTGLHSSASDCNHTDSIQGVGATGVVVIGNLFYDDDDGAVDFNDPTRWRVTDNVCYAMGRRACVSLYGDLGSVVTHNTAGPGMNVLELDTKPGSRPGRGTVFTDNVGGYSAADGSSVGTDTGNLYPGAQAPNIDGKPTFVGGASPATWSGFMLAADSVGYAASANSPVGIHPSARAGAAPQPG
jgi:hypothetical protein